MNTRPEQRSQKGSDEQLQPRGLPWAALVVLMVLTLLAALVIAYYITRNNFPAH